MLLWRNIFKFSFEKGFIPCILIWNRIKKNPSRDESCHQEDRQRRRSVGVDESGSDVSTPLIPHDGNDDGSYLRRVLRKENDKQQNEKQKESMATVRRACIYFRSYVHSRIQNYSLTVSERLFRW